MPVEYVSDLESLDPTAKFCVVEEDPRYPQQLVFQAVEQREFTIQYFEFLTRFNVLRETSLWGRFTDKLNEDGYTVYVMPSGQLLLEQYKAYTQALEIAGFEIPDGGDLFWYQKYGLQKALHADTRNQISMFFWNYGTGSGKSVIAAAGAQELFNRDLIDVVLLFTETNMKVNLVREINGKTKLTARNVEGDVQHRRKTFALGDAHVYVMNYEKTKFDWDSLEPLIKGKRVLFALDEVQKILAPDGEAKKNFSRVWMEKLFKLPSKAIIWPMSASVVKNSPDRYWQIFDFMDNNPLGTLKQFRKEYVKYEIPHRVKLKNGGQFTTFETVWDNHKLEEVPHRVAPYTHSVRKTDPGVRELFKETQFIALPVQQSPEEEKIYRYIS